MTSAFLFINAQYLFVEDVINKLKEIPEIVDVFKVQGIYDIIARVNSDTEDHDRNRIIKAILVLLCIMCEIQQEEWNRDSKIQE